MDLTGCFYERFNVEGEPATVGNRWKIYLKGFELFADARGLIIEDDKDDNKRQRLALLLHSAGPEVQRVFDTFPAAVKDDKKGYTAAITALNADFVPTVNVPFQRNLFHDMAQGAAETVAQFATRLREVGQYCAYNDLDDQIRDQIVQKCRSLKIKRELLKTGTGLTLKKALDTATTFEQVDAQLRSMSEVSEQVNAMSLRDKSESKPNNACYRCGQTGHFGRDPQCPAKNARCRKCDNIGHFESECRTKSTKQNAKLESGKPRSKSGRGAGKGYWKENRQNFVQQEFDEYDSDDSDYAFSIDYAFGINEVGFSQSNSKQFELAINCGGVDIFIIPDSGSTASTVTEDEWKKLKRGKIACTSSTDPGPFLYPYQSKKPLEVLGQFTCVVTAGKCTKTCTFRVVRGSGKNLLSRKDSESLGLLKVGYNVNAINQSYNPTKKEDKSELLKQSVKSVPTGEKPFECGKSDKCGKPVTYVEKPRMHTSEKPYEPDKSDKCETVEPSVIMYDKICDEPERGDIRVCADMKLLTKAIMCERHLIPPLDEAEIVHGMSSAQYFSKIDSWLPDADIGFSKCAQSAEDYVKFTPKSVSTRNIECDKMQILCDKMQSVIKCKSCHGCQLVACPDSPEPLCPTELPDAADFKGPVPVIPKYAQANDEVERQYERQNGFPEKRLSIAQFEKKDWKRELHTYLANVAPAKPSQVSVGDEVIVQYFQPQNKLSTPIQPQPYKVIERSGNQITVESPEGVPYKRNTSHVKVFNRSYPVEDENVYSEPALDEIMSEPVESELPAALPSAAAAAAAPSKSPAPIRISARSNKGVPPEKLDI